jgi:hypothetical protein
MPELVTAEMEEWILNRWFVVAPAHSSEVAFECANKLLTERNFVSINDPTIQQINDAEQQDGFVWPLMRTALITPEIVKPVQPVLPLMITHDHAQRFSQLRDALKLIPQVCLHLEQIKSSTDRQKTFYAFSLILK